MNYTVIQTSPNNPNEDTVAMRRGDIEALKKRLRSSESRVEYLERELASGVLITCLEPGEEPQSYDDLFICPECGGSTEQFDRCYPPNPYPCEECQERDG